MSKHKMRSQEYRIEIATPRRTTLGIEMRKVLLSNALALGLALALGCGLQPIPEIAVEGTTIIIPIPGFFEVGYGTRSVADYIPLSASSGATITGSPLLLSSTQRAKEDFQRGEMLVTLMEKNGATYDEVANLKVLYVAAVSAYPGSERGRTEYPARKRQSALVVEIPFMRDSGTTTCASSPPCSLVDDAQPAAEFFIRVQRIRRSAFTAGSTSYTRLKQSFFDQSETPPNTIDSEWFGWGDESAGGESPDRFIPIQVADSAVLEAVEADPQHVDHPSSFTKLEYWYAVNLAGSSPPPIPGMGFMAKGTISSINAAKPRPDPEFLVKVSRPSGGNLAAWSLDLAFPAHRIKITDVQPLRNRTTGTWVNYSISPAISPSCSAPSMSTLKISVADPEALTTGVLVSYQLRSEMTGVCTVNPLLPPEFGPVVVAGYDVNGAIVAGAIHEGPIGPDFEDL